MTKEKKLTRRGFLHSATTLTLGAVGGTMLVKSTKANTLWQINPDQCTQCEKCATECVLPLSAVKCVHAYDVCGYCELCGGYSTSDATKLDTAAENQLCPTGAIERTFIEDPYYEYSINEEKCIGCAKCVKGCGAFGNGSLYLQIRHDRCVNCNECAITKVCPSDAFVRVPTNKPYLLRGEQGQNT